MVLVIDNYDSFTYNLVQYLGEIGGGDIVVLRNDAITVEEIAGLRPSRIVISPGPGRPEEAGVSVDLIRAYGATIPILGVCLGHQAIGVAFGGVVGPAPSLLHGKSSNVEHDGKGVFIGIANNFLAGRYHSLAVCEEPWPVDLEITARAVDDGAVMGLRHRQCQVHGVQFHPESILTGQGKKILRNFLELELQ